MIAELGGIVVTIHLPDWFGEGEDWSSCKPPTWEYRSGNHAEDRMYEYFRENDISHDRTCMDPMGKWVSVEVEHSNDLVEDIDNIVTLIDQFLQQEEKRRAENPQDETDPDDA